MLFFFFFNDTATTEIYTLSLHDALPISGPAPRRVREAAAGDHRREPPRPRPAGAAVSRARAARPAAGGRRERERTRLKSSHPNISYGVFCFEKKKKKLDDEH